jgi:hypothetical protein
VGVGVVRLSELYEGFLSTNPRSKISLQGNLAIPPPGEGFRYLSIPVEKGSKIKVVLILRAGELRWTIGSFTNGKFEAL